ncbi:uncharacterized protein LOC131821969 [Mustela lutreola]|uniref:uncharacterized protein LOC131821969 n=1 Tax=Mustela lutreola TaxID=9666 RepID=UPI0027976A31|nr:uncharacterized protein LOC131821969 [Mustela lutreola]
MGPAGLLGPLSFPDPVSLVPSGAGPEPYRRVRTVAAGLSYLYLSTPLPRGTRPVVPTEGAEFRGPEAQRSDRFWAQPFLRTKKLPLGRHISLHFLTLPRTLLTVPTLNRGLAVGSVEAHAIQTGKRKYLLYSTHAHITTVCQILFGAMVLQRAATGYGLGSAPFYSLSTHESASRRDGVGGVQGPHSPGAVPASTRPQLVWGLPEPPRPPPRSAKAVGSPGQGPAHGRFQRRELAGRTSRPRPGLSRLHPRALIRSDLSAGLSRWGAHARKSGHGLTVGVRKTQS